MTLDEKINSRKTVKKPMVVETAMNNLVLDYECVQFDCIPAKCTANAPKPLSIWGNPMKKQEKKMYNDYDENYGAKDHLVNRAENINALLRDQAKDKYLPDTVLPDTVKDLRKALNDGWVTVDPDYKDNQNVDKYNWTRYLKVQNPALVQDKAGFTAAKAVIKTEYTKAMDAIVVLPPADGLAALRAFESTTIN